MLRRSDGSWIQGFSRYLGEVSVIKAEAWALLEGVRLVAESGVGNLIMESDSLLLVEAIKASVNYPAEIEGIVQRVRNLFEQFSGCKIRHIWREANACADYLANLGASRCEC